MQKNKFYLCENRPILCLGAQGNSRRILGLNAAKKNPSGRSGQVPVGLIACSPFPAQMYVIKFSIFDSFFDALINSVVH